MASFKLINIETFSNKIRSWKSDITIHGECKQIPNINFDK